MYKQHKPGTNTIGTGYYVPHPQLAQIKEEFKQYSNAPIRTPWSRETEERMKREARGQVRRLTELEKAALLRIHNDARAEVHAPPMSWDPELEDKAALYACQCRLEHWRNGDVPYPRGYKKNGSPDEVFGENLAWSSPSYEPTKKSPAARGSEQWAEEKPHYNCGDDSCKQGEQCGHWTQMLWPTSTRIGCAISKCPKSFGGLECTDNAPFELLVCQMTEPGNWVSPKLRAVREESSCPLNPNKLLDYGILAPYDSSLWE